MQDNERRGGSARVVAASAGRRRGPSPGTDSLALLFRRLKIRMLFFFFFSVFAAEVPVRTHGRGQKGGGR